jgi:carbonic anhydrase
MPVEERTVPMHDPAIQKTRTAPRVGRREFLALAVGVVVAGCGDGDGPPSAGSNGKIHWSYEGEAGPENWGSLDASFAECAAGSAQTPIDVAAPSPGDLLDPEFAYFASPVKVHDNGQTVQADASPGGVLRVDGEEFPLVQLHFHAPSEHTFAGESFPVEMHFVHKTAESQIAVVGVMISEGPTDNAAWSPFVDALGLGDVETAFDWMAMLPTSTSTVRYSGSLTTPPCTEGVRWFLMTDPIQLSAAQIGKFETAYSGNNRPVQPLNDRPVVLDSADAGY